MDFSLDSIARWAYFWQQLTLVRSELWLVAGMCAVLIAPFFKRDSAKAPIAVTLCSLLLALLSIGGGDAGDGSVFHGSLTIDPFSQFFKVLLYSFAALVVMQWSILRRDARSHLDTPDFMCLLLGATFGMSLMASASNLLTLFIATEAASMPSYALAGFRKRSRLGTEGSMKYVLFGAASSALMLYGLSLVYGTTGSLEFGAIARVGATTGVSPLMAIGLMGVLGGIAFKLSAAPMHFWCPDVFQGAPTEVTTFLSVASKGAAIALLVRFLGAFGNAAITLPGGPTDPHVFAGLASGVAVLGGVTAFWGNLVAYHQRNIKRLLAYSSISHAGYMIMAASVMPLADRLPKGVDSQDVTEALLFYLLIYLFMNLGAFTLAALVTQKTGSEDIEDYKGLAYRHVPLTALFMIFLLSLFGMPGLGGFMGKVFLAKGVAKLGFGGLVIIAVLLINTLISFFYYMRPIVYMCLKSPGRNLPAFVPNPAGMVLASACAFMILFTGLLPGRLSTRDYGVLAHEPLPRVSLPQPVSKPAVRATPTAPQTPQGPRGL